MNETSEPAPRAFAGAPAQTQGLEWRRAKLRARKKPRFYDPPVHWGLSHSRTGPHARKIHDWTRREVLSQGGLERGKVYTRLALWHASVPFQALVLASLHARVVRERSGKRWLRHLVECVYLAHTHSIPPRHYYMFRLDQPEQYARAGDYLFRFETKPYLYILLRWHAGGSAKVFNNKARFSEFLRANDLPAVPVFFEYILGDRCSVDATSFPERDLITKPKRGSGGSGVVRWDHLADGRWRGSNGRTFDADELDAYLTETSGSRSLLVQPRLLNHPELHDLAGDVLTTVRILTCRTPDGGSEATNASLRVPVGQNVVDNIHQGGIAAAVDLQTGRVGRATALSSRSDWIVKHPESGAPIEGRILPFWREAVELVERAHRTFPQALAVGWDVALLEDGPCLIEANSSPCVDLIQRPLGEPIGNARFGELLAHQIEAIEQGSVEVRIGPGG